jgi:hypothetical protein
LDLESDRDDLEWKESNLPEIDGGDEDGGDGGDGGILFFGDGLGMKNHRRKKTRRRRKIQNSQLRVSMTNFILF